MATGANVVNKDQLSQDIMDGLAQDHSESLQLKELLKSGDACDYLQQFIDGLATDEPLWSTIVGLVGSGGGAYGGQLPSYYRYYINTLEASASNANSHATTTVSDSNIWAVPFAGPMRNMNSVSMTRDPGYILREAAEGGDKSLFQFYNRASFLVVVRLALEVSSVKDVTFHLQARGFGGEDTWEDVGPNLDFRELEVGPMTDRKISAAPERHIVQGFAHVRMMEGLESVYPEYEALRLVMRRSEASAETGAIRFYKNANSGSFDPANYIEIVELDDGSLEYNHEETVPSVPTPPTAAPKPGLVLTDTSGETFLPAIKRGGANLNFTALNPDTTYIVRMMGTGSDSCIIHWAPAGREPQNEIVITTNDQGEYTSDIEWLIPISQFKRPGSGNNGHIDSLRNYDAIAYVYESDVYRELAGSTEPVQITVDGAEKVPTISAVWNNTTVALAMRTYARLDIQNLEPYSEYWLTVMIKLLEPEQPADSSTGRVAVPFDDFQEITGTNAYQFRRFATTNQTSAPQHLLQWELWYIKQAYAFTTTKTGLVKIELTKVNATGNVLAASAEVPITLLFGATS